MSSGFAAVAVLYETEPYCFLQLCLERKKIVMALEDRIRDKRQEYRGCYTSSYGIICHIYLKRIITLTGTLINLTSI